MPVFAEEDAVEASALGEPQREFRLALVIVEVRNVDQRAALPGNRLHDRRMVVAERVHADAAQQIEIAFALFVDDVHAFAADEEDRATLIRGQQQPVLPRRESLRVSSLHLSRAKARTFITVWHN